MGNQSVLSSRFNMSLGYLPAVISILMCEFTTQDMAIYIGAGVGLLYSAYMFGCKAVRIPQLILYGTTAMLLLLTIASLFFTNYCPEEMTSFTLEVSTLIPPLVLFLNRRRVLSFHASLSQKQCKQFFAQGAEASIVSAKVLLIVGALHFLIILCTIALSGPLGDTTLHILYGIAPASVFILSILFNQLGLHYFNHVMKFTLFLPVVNKRGDVIGKAIASEAISQKHDYINPVVRIAVASHGMLFLMPRLQCVTPETGKTDIPLESHLYYGESLQQATGRMLRNLLPNAPLSNLHFNLAYHFENEETNRLIYLYTLDLDDDSILDNKNLKGGKLWTFKQIEQNLEQNFFSRCFENEYEEIKSIIQTREDFKKEMY